MRLLHDTEVNKFGGYIKIFYLGEQAEQKKKQSPESTRGGHNPPGRALVYRAHQGHFPGSFLFS